MVMEWSGFLISISSGVNGVNSKPNWDLWDKALKSAHWWVWKRCRHHPFYEVHGEDIAHEVAIRLLTDGWNLEWRLADLMRDWYGRDNFPVRMKSHLIDVEDLLDTGPEFLTYISERMSGRPLMASGEKRDYKVAMSAGEFAKRWG
jgi:hypothetical protein